MSSEKQKRNEGIFEEMPEAPTVAKAVQSDWGLSSRQESFITSARKGFLITALVTIFAGFLSAFSPSYTSLVILRCLVGVGLGDGPVLSSWFLEFIPAPDRDMGDYSGATTMFTVDQALVSMGFGKFHGLVLAYAGMGWVSEAMEMMLLSFVGPAVQSEWGLSSRQESLITSVVFAGMLVGGYLWGVVADNYGRRKGFLITSIVTFTAGFLSAFSPNYTSLIILRCLVGVGLGRCPVLPSWFLEFIPSPKRGTWMVIFSTFWVLGNITALISLPFIILFLTFLKTLRHEDATPESPRYLCVKGRTTEALHILEKIARVNRVEMPSGTLISDHTNEFDEEKSTTSQDTPLLLSLRKSGVAAVPKKNEFKIKGLSSSFMLFSPKLVRTTLLLWVVFFANSFCYYGLVLLTSQLVHPSGQCGSTRLHPQKTQDTSAYRDVFITSLAEIPGLLLLAVIVDRLGRKVSISSTFFASCIFLLPLVFHQPETLTTGFLFGARICISAASVVIYIYAPEIYPTSVRATGVGVASAVGRIGGIVCPFVAVGLVQGCHQAASIILFVIVAFLSGVAVMFFLFDTTGRTSGNALFSSSNVYKQGLLVFKRSRGGNICNAELLAADDRRIALHSPISPSFIWTRLQRISAHPFTLLPVSAVEKPGNLMMQSLVDRLVPLLLQQLRQDYDNWVQEKCVKYIHNT
ncbi:hypothetical protein GIB67_009855 [Kingdonia uniflora]|uniref:Major facilitator superfamily (MFS) profile domain-containing protein n=1 Tax=Kingdonia uniflora TaxID=39325 RepID=A0A7J7LN08_9MAGN|nr:hypothetical protein GIB67_009855 [Kingdonia uniflora]